MKHLTLILLFLFSHENFAKGQDTIKQENVFYIVDSIPIIDDPEEGTGNLSQEDIELLTVVTSKSEIEKWGYKNVDKIIFITTKEYAKRPDEIKKVPTTKLMERKDGAWYLKNSNTPYCGQFIDYFANGKKQGEGILQNGKLEGLRTVYQINGNKSYFRNYSNGIENGESEEYFINGKLHQKGNFRNGKDDGVWKEWYSTGVLKRQSEFKDGKALLSKTDEEFYSLFNKGIELMKNEEYKSAIKKLDKAIQINSNYADVYFYRGTAKLNSYDFDAALDDLNKAIELEPLYMESLGNRAYTRIRKYEFKNSRVLNNNSSVTVLVTKENIEIPNDEKVKICDDLKRCSELGDTNKMITDAIEKYCK